MLEPKMLNYLNWYSYVYIYYFHQVFKQLESWSKNPLGLNGILIVKLVCHGMPLQMF